MPNHSHKGLIPFVLAADFGFVSLILASLWICRVGIHYDLHRADGQPHSTKWIRSHNAGMSIQIYFGSGNPRFSRVRIWGPFLPGFIGIDNPDNAGNPAGTYAWLSYGYPLLLTLTITALSFKRFRHHRLSLLDEEVQSPSASPDLLPRQKHITPTPPAKVVAPATKNAPSQVTLNYAPPPPKPFGRFAVRFAYFSFLLGFASFAYPLFAYYVLHSIVRALPSAFHFFDDLSQFPILGLPLSALILGILAIKIAPKGRRIDVALTAAIGILSCAFFFIMLVQQR